MEHHKIKMFTIKFILTIDNINRYHSYHKLKLIFRISYDVVNLYRKQSLGRTTLE